MNLSVLFQCWNGCLFGGESIAFVRIPCMIKSDTEVLSAMPQVWFLSRKEESALKILIIEDETVIRNGLLKHISWESLGVDEIRVAENAERAYMVCQDYIPDIVLSDIFMPGENGIELCRRLRKLFPEVEIIFVTGYADKEYLKAAIDLHAVRYVEKPICRENISEAISEAVQRVTRTREQKEACLHALFLDSASQPFYTNGKNVFCVGILHLACRDRLAAVKERLTESLDTWMDENDLNILMEISDTRTLSFLLGGRDRLPCRESVKAVFGRVMTRILGENVNWFLTIGSQADAVEDVTRSWQEAGNAQRSLVYTGWKHIVFADELQGKHELEADDSVVEKFAEAVLQKNEEAAIALLDQFADVLRRDQVFFSGDIRHIYYGIHSVLKRAEQAMCLNDKRDGEGTDFFESVQTYEEINRYLKSRIVALAGDAELQKGTYVVQKVMDYIWKNYGDSSLSIRVLAEYVYLTPTYLSSLFKKGAGITIGQYMVDVRIENAKRLMKDPRLKFYEVARMVGYEDANYFAKIFKKKTQMTPSEYKESLSLK